MASGLALGVKIRVSVRVRDRGPSHLGEGGELARPGGAVHDVDRRREVAAAPRVRVGVRAGVGVGVRVRVRVRVSSRRGCPWR